MTRLKILTDHSSLLWILNMADATGKLERWRLRLSEMQFDVYHGYGIKNQAVDSLSRLQTTNMESIKIEDDIPVFLIIGYEEEKSWFVHP